MYEYSLTKHRNEPVKALCFQAFFLIIYPLFLDHMMTLSQILRSKKDSLDYKEAHVL